MSTAAHTFRFLVLNAIVMDRTIGFRFYWDASRRPCRPISFHRSTECQSGCRTKDLDLGLISDLGPTHHRSGTCLDCPGSRLYWNRLVQMPAMTLTVLGILWKPSWRQINVRSVTFSNTYQCGRLPVWLIDCSVWCDNLRAEGVLRAVNRRYLHRQQLRVDNSMPALEQTQPLRDPSFRLARNNCRHSHHCGVNIVMVIHGSNKFNEKYWKYSPQWCFDAIRKFNVDIEQSLLILGG